MDVPARGLVLVVEDETILRTAFERMLRRNNWAVVTAGDGSEGRAMLERHAFDVIVSDIQMGGYGGMSFLRAVRERDADVPVILMTGQPTIETTMRAIELGVFRYLAKPVGPDQLEEVVSRAALMHKLARIKRRALALSAPLTASGDLDTLEARFASAVERSWLAFQPIVDYPRRTVLGYEALIRSDEPTLRNPLALLEAAERLGRMNTVGRLVRGNVARASLAVPPELVLFVNLHASDLEDDDLLSAGAALTVCALRVVLEITERASLAGVKDLGRRVTQLKALGYRIAIDDLGQGYAGLASFMQLEPHFVKLDMGLVRGIDADPRKQVIVRSLLELCDELGMTAISEGVETPAERDMLVSLGASLMQGYLFAKPAPPFPEVVW